MKREDGGLPPWETLSATANRRRVGNLADVADRSKVDGGSALKWQPVRNGDSWKLCGPAESMLGFIVIEGDESGAVSELPRFRPSSFAS